MSADDVLARIRSALVSVKCVAGPWRRACACFVFLTGLAPSRSAQDAGSI